MAGTTLSRSVFSACWDSASLPSPASGMLTRATVWSGLTVTSIGLFISPVARAWRFSWPISNCACGELTLSALTTTTAGSGPPGKSFCTWL